MPHPDQRTLAFLKVPAAAALTCLLVVQAAGYYLMPRTERGFESRPLAGLPIQLEKWTSIQEIPIEDAVQAVLKADDTLNRVYSNPAESLAANLFIAFFKSQTTGVAPHSPKNCLPGSGWLPLVSGTIRVPVQGRAEPVEVNRYIVAHGEERTLVLYWYQTPRRVIASEFSAKFWLVLDALRYRRSDTSLVRVVVPIRRDGDAQAESAAVHFVQALLPTLTDYLPH